MKKVRWANRRPNHRRVLDPAALQALGIDKDEPLIFSKENGFILELSNQASDSLVTRLPDEFSYVDPNEEGSSDVDDESVPDRSGADNPQERSSDPEEDEKSDRRKSPPKRSN